MRRSNSHTIGRIFLFSLIIFCIFLSAEVCNSDEKAGESAQTLLGKKIVMIIAHNNFRDEELLTPLDVLEKRGASVTIASSSLEPATGMLGASVTPDILVKDVDIDDYNAVIFVGGSGAHEYTNSPVAFQLAQSAFIKGKVVGAICIAPSILANAGILEGKRATCFSSEAPTLKRKGARYTAEDVEIDGTIITGNGPSAALPFALAVARTLTNQE